MYFLSFQNRWFWPVRHLNMCVKRKFFLIKIQKHGFETWKNSKKPQKYNNILQPNFTEWFGIKIIDLIRFMTLLWSISAHWCFQQIFGSGLALGWCDTPRFNHWQSCFYDSPPILGLSKVLDIKKIKKKSSHKLDPCSLWGAS